MKYCAGDTIKIISCRNLRLWQNYKSVVDKEIILNAEEACELNDGCMPHFWNNKYCINYPKECIQLVKKFKKEIKKFGIVSWTKKYYK